MKSFFNNFTNIHPNNSQSDECSNEKDAILNSFNQSNINNNLSDSNENHTSNEIVKSNSSINNIIKDTMDISKDINDASNDKLCFDVEIDLQTILRDINDEKSDEISDKNCTTSININTSCDSNTKGNFSLQQCLKYKESNENFDIEDSKKNKKLKVAFELDLKKFKDNYEQDINEIQYEDEISSEIENDNEIKLGKSLENENKTISNDIIENSNVLYEISSKFNAIYQSSIYEYELESDNETLSAFAEIESVHGCDNYEINNIDDVEQATFNNENSFEMRSREFSDELTTIVEEDAEDELDENVINNTYIDLHLKEELHELIDEITSNQNKSFNLKEAQNEIIKMLQEIKNPETTEGEINFNSNCNSMDKNFNLIHSHLLTNIVDLENNEFEYYMQDFYEFKFFTKKFIDNLKKINNFPIKLQITNGNIYSLEKVEDINLSRKMVKLKSSSVERIIFLFNNDQGQIFQIRDYCNFNFNELIKILFDENDISQLEEIFFSKNENILLLVSKICKLKTINYFDICRKTVLVLINVLIYLHSRNILHLNLTIGSIGITNNGCIKICDLSHSVKPDKKLLSNEFANLMLIPNKDNYFNKKYNFTSDYLLMGQIILSIFIPKFEFLCLNKFPFDKIKQNIDINRNLINCDNWYEYFFHNEQIEMAKNLILNNIENCDLKNFLLTCFKETGKRCEGFVKDIWIRSDNLKSQYRDRILVMDSIKMLSLFSDLNEFHLMKQSLIDVTNIFPNSDFISMDNIIKVTK